MSEEEDGTFFLYDRRLSCYGATPLDQSSLSTSAVYLSQFPGAVSLVPCGEGGAVWPEIALDEVDVLLEGQNYALIFDSADQELSMGTRIVRSWLAWKAFFWKQWFTLGIVVAVVAAAAAPGVGRKGGPLAPEVTMKYGAVALIFFLSGLSLKTRRLGESLLHLRLNAVAQLWVFVITPGFTYLVVLVLRETELNRYLLDGCVTLMCLPTTVSSCIVLTKSVGGNEAAALFNATVANLLGIVLSPALVLLFLGSTGSVPFEKILVSLCLSVLLPLVVGQIVQNVFYKQLLGRNLRAGPISKFVLLLIVWTTFCTTFSNGIDLDSPSLFAMIGVLGLLHGLFLGGTYMMTSLPFLGYSRADRGALLFLCPQKTLAVGVPLLNVMYDGDPNLGIILIPLLIYHPLELFIAGGVVEQLADWISDEKDTLAKAEEAALLEEGAEDVSPYEEDDSTS